MFGQLNWATIAAVWYMCAHPATVFSALVPKPPCIIQHRMQKKADTLKKTTTTITQENLDTRLNYQHR